MGNRFLFLPHILEQQLDAVLDRELELCLHEEPPEDKDPDIVPFPTVSTHSKEPLETIRCPEAA